MRSPLRTIGLGVLPALLVTTAPPPSADACSMSRSPWTDFKQLAAAPQHGGLQLRYWHTLPTAFVFEIVDADGRRVPAAVRSWRIPWDAWWRDVQTYSVLEPVEPLPHGRYTVRTGLLRDGRVEAWDKATFTVAAPAVGDPAGPAPATLSAAIVDGQCQVSTEADCSPLRTACVHLELLFDVPGEAPPRSTRAFPRPMDPVLELTWAPVVNGRVDPSRRRSAPGFRSIAHEGRRRLRVPAWWFAGLSGADSALQVELRVIDGLGRRGPPSKVTVPRPALLAEYSTSFRPDVVLSLEASQHADLRRFAAVSNADGRRFFESLDPIAPSTPGAPVDAAFRDALVPGGDVMVHGRVPGLDVPVQVRARVERGKVQVPLTAEDLARFLSVLPAPSGDLTLKGVFLHQLGATVETVFAGIGPRTLTWDRTTRNDLGTEVAEMIRMRRIMDADPVLQRLVDQHGAGRRGVEPRRAWAALGGTIEIVWHLEADGRVRRSLRGPLEAFAAGDLETLVASAMRRLRVKDRAAPAELEIGTDGRLSLEVSLPDWPHTHRFEGRLGDERLQELSRY